MLTWRSRWTIWQRINQTLSRTKNSSIKGGIVYKCQAFRWIELWKWGVQCMGTGRDIHSPPVQGNCLPLDKDRIKFGAYIWAIYLWICNRETQTLSTGMIWKYPAFHLLTSQPCVPLPARQISKQVEISGDSGGISCAAPGYLLIESHQPKISNRILLWAAMFGFWADIHWSCLLLIMSCQNSEANKKLQFIL